MDLTHDKLPELFKNIRYNEQSSSVNNHVYYLKKNGIDILSIHYLGENEWRFIADNFPFPRKFYYTNFPIKTVDRFISEMKHIGFTVELIP